jgi:hypothetical protein
MPQRKFPSAKTSAAVPCITETPGSLARKLAEMGAPRIVHMCDCGHPEDREKALHAAAMARRKSVRTPRRCGLSSAAAAKRQPFLVGEMSFLAPPIVVIDAAAKNDAFFGDDDEGAACGAEIAKSWRVLVD